MIGGVGFPGGKLPIQLTCALLSYSTMPVSPVPDLDAELVHAAGAAVDRREDEAVVALALDRARPLVLGLRAPVLKLKQQLPQRRGSVAAARKVAKSSLLVRPLELDVQVEDPNHRIGFGGNVDADPIAGNGRGGMEAPVHPPRRPQRARHVRPQPALLSRAS